MFGKSAVIAGLGLGAFALAAFADTWQSAPPSPPNCPDTYEGCNPPINVGSSQQAKTGILGLANFIFNPTGTPTVTKGYVLTAMDTSGTVGWAAASSSSSTGGGVPNKIIVLNYSGGIDSDGSPYSPTGGPGTYSITINSPVKARIRAWGAGGGGGAINSDPVPGGAGGGGAYAEGIVSLAAGTYTVKVGLGGAGGTTANQAARCGLDGTASSFALNSTVYISAAGGQGGGGGCGDSRGVAGGSGGSYSGTAAIIGMNGGDGGNGGDRESIGGNSPEGGFGTAQNKESGPTAPGGGGGGGVPNNGVSYYPGFAGAIGRVIIELAN